jgi:hypothetical protein
VDEDGFESGGEADMVNAMNAPESPSDRLDDAGRLELAAARIRGAREYTLTLLGDLEPGDWFWNPSPAVTHLAWQVGHLAFAQYGLVLFRQRGRLPIDADLMSGRFRKTFSRGSTPVADPAAYPDIDEIRATFDRVHQQAMLELVAMSADGLDDAVEAPYAVWPTRFGALLFAADHEMLHAGQIGLLRRLMGKAPIR